MAVRNARKSKIVYDVIDAYPDFYVGRAQKDSRSLMNATFNLPTSELEALFVESAAQNGMVGLKGHRVSGGIRLLCIMPCRRKDAKPWLLSWMISIGATADYVDQRPLTYSFRTWEVFDVPRKVRTAERR